MRAFPLLCSLFLEISSSFAGEQPVRGCIKSDVAIVAKSVYDSLLRAVNDKRNMNSTPTTTEDIANDAYQMVINMMACCESIKSMKSSDEFSRCLSEKTDLSFAMVKAILNYNKLGISTSECRAKTEMYEMEMRYPPYDWMRTISKEIRAYDAKAFFECIRR